MPYDPNYNPLADYHSQNRMMMAQIAAQLQGNMQLMGSNVPLANSTYISPQLFTAPTLFGQFTNIIGSLMGDEAGAMAQMGGQLAISPALRPYLGPLPGLVSSMMGSMPIGSSTDPGAFMYSQLQNRLGRNIPGAVQLPYDFSSKAGIDLYNEQVAQFSQFLNPQTSFGPGVPVAASATRPQPPAAQTQALPSSTGYVPYRRELTSTNGAVYIQEAGTVNPIAIPMLAESQRGRVIENFDELAGARRHMLEYAANQQKVTFEDFNKRFEGTDPERDRVKARFQIYEAQRARELESTGLNPQQASDRVRREGVSRQTLDAVLSFDFLTSEGDETDLSKRADAALARLKIDEYAARLPDLAKVDLKANPNAKLDMPDLAATRSVYQENVELALSGLTPTVKQDLATKANARGVTKENLQMALADTALSSATLEQRNKENEEASRLFDDLAKALSKEGKPVTELPLSDIKDKILPKISGTDPALQQRAQSVNTVLQNQMMTEVDTDIGQTARQQADAQVKGQPANKPAPEAPTPAPAAAPAPAPASTPTAAGAFPVLRQFDESIGKIDSGYGYGVQLGNIRTLSGSERFKDVFAMFSAVTGQSTTMEDEDIKRLIDLSTRGQEGAKEAQALLEGSPELKSKADRIINTANNAASMANLAMNVSKMLPSGMVRGAEAGALENLGDIFMGLTGLDRNPTQFTSAAVQSLSMMGALGTETIVEPDGRRVFAAERVSAGLTANMENASSPFTSTRSLGAARAGTLMNELAKSGILTSGGVDVFGSIKPEDIRKMEQSVAQQLEGFSEVAKAGRRIGMQVNEILPAMQSIYGGTFAEALSNQAGRIRAEMRADEAGTAALESRENERRRAAGGTDMSANERQVFLEAEAQRRAGVSMMQQVEKAVQIGRFAGLDPRGSMAVMQTASQLSTDMGLGAEAGMAMGMSAMSRVSTSRNMGMPMTIDQSLALSRDIMAKGANNPSVQAFASLSLAVGTGVLKQEDVGDLINAFREGKDIDPGEVNRRIAATGANLSAFTGREAVARGMTMAANDINRFYSSNENVSVTGAVKAAFRQGGIDPEALVQKMISGQGEEVAKAFGFVDEGGQVQLDKLEGMDFTQFTAQFNKIKDQQSRVDFLDKLEASGTITEQERAQLLSNLGERMDRFGLASDKGSMRTARIRQAEEAERAKLGGSTMIELRAAAVVENQALINQAIGPVNNMQQGLESGLKSIREGKIKKMMDKFTGSEEQKRKQAEEAVDKEGFTLPELLSSATVLTDPAMKTSLETARNRVIDDLKRAQESNDVARAEQLKLQLNDIEAMQDISVSKTPEERARRIDELRARQEQDIAEKDKADKSKMTEDQKKNAEVADATVRSREVLEAIAKKMDDVANYSQQTARSIQSLDAKVV